VKPVYLFFVLLFTGTCVACARSDPPGAKSIAEAQNHRPIGVNRAPVADGGMAAPATSTNSLSTDAGLAARALSTDASTSPAPGESLLDASGEPKPQTNEKPQADDPGFQTRVASLCDAIINGSPEKSHEAFFPLVAYRQVKAIADPDRDYRLRLLRHFDRDILEYHQKLVKRPTPLACSGLIIPEGQARWMKPGSEYNRIGYFRVLRSKLAVKDAGGNTVTLEVTSLISWRGQWYVVHLNGFE